MKMKKVIICLNLSINPFVAKCYLDAANVCELFPCPLSVSYIDFMYYLYAFSGYNGMELTGKMIVLGIAVNVITGIILVYGISRQSIYDT